MSRVVRRARSLGGLGLIAALAFTAAPITIDTAAAQPLPQPAECVPVASAVQLRCSVKYLAVGAVQEFVVPDGITSLEVELVGGNGGDVADNLDLGGALGGSGARVTGTLPDIVPGESLLVVVGGNGGTGTAASAGFNGGGAAGDESNSGWRAAGGGGATDIRRTPDDLSSRLAVAGGGGGAVVGNTSGNNYSGVAGGDASSEGSVPNTGCSAAQPGTTNAGGSGGSCRSGAPGTPGTVGTGGVGGIYGGPGAPIGGGGGGGGYYGGGGGVGGYYSWDDPSEAGSGAGGSSLVPAGGTESSSLHAEPSATVSYLVDIDSITVPPVFADALSARGFSAFTTGPGGEQIDMSSLIAGIAPGSDRLSCTDSLCTASESGEFPVTLAFGTSGRTTTSTFTASKLAQSISFSGGEFTAGSTFSLSGAATSGLALNYSARSGGCSIEGTRLTANTAGICLVAANQSGNATYLSAAEVVAEIRVATEPQPLPHDSASSAGSHTALTSAASDQILAQTGAGDSNAIMSIGAFSALAGAALILTRHLRRTGEGSLARQGFMATRVER